MYPTLGGREMHLFFALYLPFIISSAPPKPAGPGPAMRRNYNLLLFYSLFSHQPGWRPQLHNFLLHPWKGYKHLLCSELNPRLRGPEEPYSHKTIREQVKSKIHLRSYHEQGLGVCWGEKVDEKHREEVHVLQDQAASSQHGDQARVCCLHL